MEHILSAVIFVPMLGALIALFAPEKAAKWICTIFAVLAFLVSIPLATGFQQPDAPSFKTFVEQRVLPEALKRHGITQPAQQDAALALLKVEKERSRLQARAGSAEGRDRVALAAQLEQKRTEEAKAHGHFLATFEGQSESADRSYASFVRDAGDLDDAARSKLAPGMRYTEHMDWIPTFRIHYLVAVDGLSLPIILLTTLLTVLCLVYSWNFDYDKPPAERRPLKGFYILFLILESGLVGVFCALDFFLFFVFWEIVLLPSYFLIGIWGGENRNYASIKFFIYTLVGSITMLIGILALYFRFTPHTFNVLALQELATQYAGTGLYSTRFQVIMFGLLFLGFAIKVPVFPFHTWLPDAHVQAPTAFSVMLAGVMLKMGGYGFFRFSLPLCPDAMLQNVMIWTIGGLGMINIVYGALVAMGQSDFKSLVAYSSVSHMGYVLLGLATLTATGLDGAALQMVNHGFSSAGMFFVVGIIYDRAHHRDLNKFGGLALQMPRYFGFSLVILFASLGLPGLNGFISEAFTFIGCWQSTYLPRWMTITAMVGGILFGAAYILWTIRRVFLGPLTVEKYKHFPDLELRETFALAPLALGCVVLGVYPRLVTENLGLEAAIQTILGILGPQLPGFPGSSH
ncbi:MAG: NuoM family protein [Planctomycetota bacterium]